MAYQHIRGQNHNTYKSESHRLRFPSIDKNPTRGERKSRQNYVFLSKQSSYQADQQDLRNENKKLNERLLRYDFSLKYLEELSDEVIQLQTMEIQKLNSKNFDLEREVDLLRTELNRNINDAEEDKDPWLKGSNQRISHLQRELNKSLIEIRTVQNEKATMEQRLSIEIASQGDEVKLCRLKIKDLEKELSECKEQLAEAKRLSPYNTQINGRWDMRQEERQMVERSVVNDANEYQLEIQSLNQRLQDLHTKLRETEAELGETKSRLSKVMGERLTDNNPNIADLTDNNRPTKLAERYAELYDNQWTDAFNVLMKGIKNEEQTIETLLNILQDVQNFSRTKAQEQMIGLRSVLEFSDVDTQENVSSDAKKMLKDCRKTMASSSIKNLYRMYVTRLMNTTDNSLKSALQIREFTKECLEICWYMVVQDPPVTFAKLSCKGSMFDTDLYKAFTRSGSHVDFVVWPPLLLHDNGPVLMKGVAQGTDDKAQIKQNTDMLSYI